MSAPVFEHEFLALEVVHGGATGTSVLCKRLMAMKDVFYGGAATALACSMMEHASGRPAVWCSVQMINTAAVGDQLVIEVDEIKGSPRVTQLRVAGRVGDDDIFLGLGSTGSGEVGVDVTFATMPAVAAPQDCPPVDWSYYPAPEHTYVAEIEMREATLLEPSTNTDSVLARWARIPAVPVWSAAKLAFIADTASTGIAWAVRRASGSYRAGSSLDNSLRFGPRCDDEWVLVVSDADMVHNSFGQGSVRIWAESGTLLAAGSQTFALRASIA